MELINENDIRSRQKYNNFRVKYSSTEPVSPALKQFLMVEYYLYLKSFPCEKRIVNDYVSDFLYVENKDLMEEYDLGGFEVYVQDVKRTFIDKIFAICDYYETGSGIRNSRHLYDLHKIWSFMAFDKNEFIKLFKLVSDERTKNKANLSAQADYPIMKTLHKIINENFYRHDYNSSTKLLLFETIEYEKCINSLKEIMDSGYIPDYVTVKDDFFKSEQHQTK